MEVNERKRVQPSDYDTIYDEVKLAYKRISEKNSTVSAIVEKRRGTSSSEQDNIIFDEMEKLIGLEGSIISITNKTYDAMVQIINTNGKTVVSDNLLLCIKENLKCMDNITDMIEEKAASLNNEKNVGGIIK